MRKNIVMISIAAFTFILISSCRNKEIPEYDVDFTFIEPAAGEVFSSGDELHMEIDIQGTQPLSHIEVVAINNTTGDTIANFPVSTVEQFYPFHEHIVLAVGVVSDCRVVANAWASDYADRITEEIAFTVNP